MSYSVEIVADSVAPNGARLTTFALKYPRMIHAELMTHRVFCLAGDSELEFDLPSGSRGKYRRVYRMTIADFVTKWIEGANRTSCNPKQVCDLSWINDDVPYAAVEVAAKLGMSGPSNIRTMCVSGALVAEKEPGNREWYIYGSEIRKWRTSSPDHSRFDIRARLSGMRIRQLNEDTGDIQCSSVVSACRSGVKSVFELCAGDYRVAGSADHRIFTADGWKPIKSIRTGEMIVVRRYGKKDDEKTDPLRLKKIDGIWRSRWQAGVRADMIKEDPICRRCRRREGTEIHHVVPVCVDQTRATDGSNVTLLCEYCHYEMHTVQGWQGGNHLYGALAKVDSVMFRGEEQTYDLEIAGIYRNFIANGVVVHNSRNASSTRAIPTAKMIEWIERDPAMPVYWGKNQKGMQAAEELKESDKEAAVRQWLRARDEAIISVKNIVGLGVHKQIASRILEPWAHINVVVSSTDFLNFFALRCHWAAMPEIQKLAVMMARAYRDSVPAELHAGWWHLPFATPDELQELCRLRQEDTGEITSRELLDYLFDLKRACTARCARVSYKTFEGKEPNLVEDIALHDRLAASGHWSPFEHCAQALRLEHAHRRSGNFMGWGQYRKAFVGENRAEFDFGSLGRFGEAGFIVQE